MKILSGLVSGIRAGRMLRRFRVDGHSAELSVGDFGLRCDVTLQRHTGGLHLGVAVVATAAGAAVGIGIGSFVLGSAGPVAALVGGGALALAGATLAAKAVGYKLELSFQPDQAVDNGGQQAAA